MRRTVMALAEEAKAKQHHTLARRLASLIEERPTAQRRQRMQLPMPDKIRELVFQIQPQRSLRDLILPKTVVTELANLVEEYQQADLLRSHSVEPRHTMLLQGPPGTGKTSLAEALATELGLPFFVVRYDGVIGSYLGETASRLNDLLEFASSTPCVLFFDEFDAIGKERGDVHETGEIKRVVSSLLIQLDALPSHVFVVCATNHPELLDRAVWRRFEVHLLLPLPGKLQIRRWTSRLLEELGFGRSFSAEEIADIFAGASFSDLEQFGLELKRRLILAQDKDPQAEMQSTLKKWAQRLRLTAGKKKNDTRTSDTLDLFDADGTEDPRFSK
ncbi:AAA family ATPase [Labrys sp. La1]|uniref:AAA family ATPase n=1 Tax=Labrys sp. La1 TaxID=3404917 RepID=UPI003EBFBCEB